MKTKSKTKAVKPTFIAFLLDRTGSMTTCKTETISGFNSYIKELRKSDKGQARFSLTQFDSQGIDLIHDGVPLKQVKELNDETFVPRSWTPLFDAIGHTITATKLAASSKFKILFVTLTDGQENCSKEWTSDTIKNFMKACEAEGWTFAHIGVGAAGWSATKDLCFGTQSAANFVHVTPQNVKKAFVATASATMSYARSCSDTCATSFYAGHKGKDDDE